MRRKSFRVYSAAALSMRWVVSVEGFPTPVRTALLKGLQSALGLVAVDGVVDQRTAQQQPLVSLLARMRALQRAPDSSAILWQGTWLPHRTEHPLLTTLYRDLARALASRCCPHPTTHLMVCLHVDAHEAFEAALTCPAVDPRFTCLADLAVFEDILCHAAHHTPGPFPVQIVDVRCPPYAIDHPVTMSKLVDLACGRCQAIIARSS